MKKNILLAVSLSCFIFLNACDAVQNQLKPDREGNMEIQDYRDALASRVESDAELASRAANASIPSLQPYIAQPQGDLKSMPLVSISVNQSVPLKDILFELAQQTDYDIELDPGISGSIIFTARNRPFDEVIGRIARLAGLRYNFDDDVLRVEIDTPYNELYKVNYLSYVRSSSGSIRNDVNVVSGDGADTGSNFQSSSESEIDFWGELETNLDQIITGAMTRGLKTDTDPTITVAENSSGVETAGDGDAVLNVQSLPVSGGSSSSEEGEEQEATFSINKQAGLVSVFAPEIIQKHVKNYLEVLDRNASAQVLIEAKILEVTLTDKFSTGINWDFLDLPGDISNLNLDLSATTTSAINLNIDGADVSTVIGALASFGTVKALASPRITVLNNQSAVMNIADNLVFFDIDVDVSEDDDGAGGTDTSVDVDADIRNVPEGILVNVQPSIDLEKRTITLALRPTITSTDGPGVENPAVAFAIQSLSSTLDVPAALVPQLTIQEIDSVVKVNSGNAIIMGGLIQDKVTVDQTVVPILGEVPLMGALFRSQEDVINKTELVIFLKATILDDATDSVDNMDKDLYRRFSSDRRPFRF